MPFEWDAEKREANLEERCFDFAFASSVFDGPTLEKQDRRKDCREREAYQTAVEEAE